MVTLGLIAATLRCAASRVAYDRTQAGSPDDYIVLAEFERTREEDSSEDFGLEVDSKEVPITLRVTTRDGMKADVLLSRLVIDLNNL